MSGLDNMKKRLQKGNYDFYDGRNVKGKYNSFRSALQDSYQAEYITLDKDSPNERRWRCLINSSRLTEQFDKKVISIDFDSNVKEGTVFWWDRTKLYWMISLQQHTEEAYFRGLITRADYEFDIDGHKYHAILRGPEEETTEWKQKHGLIYNELNYSLALQIAKDNRTVNYFTRHQVTKVKLSYPDADTGEMIEEYHNWKVVATDKYSSNFLIDVYLDEWNNNEMEDVKIEQSAKEPDIMHPYIEGPINVYGFDSDLSYSIVGYKQGTWEISNPKLAKFLNCTKDKCKIEILTGKTNKFKLKFTSDNGAIVEQEILIKSF